MSAEIINFDIERAKRKCESHEDQLKLIERSIEATDKLIYELEELLGRPHEDTKEK